MPMTMARPLTKPTITGNEAPQFEGARKQLDKARQNQGDEEVFQPHFGASVGFTQFDGTGCDNSDGACGTGDHARTTAHGGSDEANKHGGPEADHGTHAGKEGEGNGFRHESQGHRKA